MSELQVSGTERVPSNQLSMLIKNAGDNMADFVTSWQEIKEVGRLEGFSEKELQAMVTDKIREQLIQMGLPQKTVSNKIYYLMNSDDVKEKRNQRYAKDKVLNIQSNDYNNDIEDSSSDWDKDSAMDEIARLQTDLNDANETIRSMSFDENPDIFRINKEDPNSMVFTKLKGSDCIDLIRNDLKKDKFYDIAWKEAV